ncbi:MAG: hypothetical protein AVDCRST_MAG08-1352 [uncultured Acetobacteraceae bacterium]|uniref:Uncharacterized protein n=1 Tax=uncultured Acetobacteraceae bacterium TaxID=169975 RepID=A0A6J4HYQ0_9PROT|nr:MAG: hypothetical protein AVDCRST_MAG08-1352 [uncultured Acetobacteraceae bacterium]
MRCGRSTPPWCAPTGAPRVGLGAGPDGRTARTAGSTRDPSESVAPDARFSPKSIVIGFAAPQHQI